MNGKICHEIGTPALRKGTNGSFVIALDKNICITNAHHPRGKDGELNGNPFEPPNVPAQTFPSIK